MMGAMFSGERAIADVRACALPLSPPALPCTGKRGRGRDARRHAPPPPQPPASSATSTTVLLDNELLTSNNGHDKGRFVAWEPPLSRRHVRLG